MDVPTDRFDGDNCPECQRLNCRRTSRQVVIRADGRRRGDIAAEAHTMISEVASGPTRTVVVSHPATTERYVQLLVGWGKGCVEVSSNCYLTGGDALTPAQELALHDHGMAPPDLRPNGWT